MYQVSYFLQLNATRKPDELALVTFDRTMTWAELDEESRRLARGLQARGISKGDVVAYYLRNCWELVTVWWATQMLGAIAQPLNIRLLPHEIAHCLAVSGAKALFYQDIDPIREGMEEICAQSELELVVACRSDGGIGRHIPFVEMMAEDPEDFVAEDIRGNDGSLLLFTSGTTGEPKGVLRSQRVMRDYALMLALGNDRGSAAPQHETLVTLCPMFHTAGMSLLMKMVLGGTLVLFDGFHARKMLDAIDAYHATQMLLIPPNLYLRLPEARTDAHDLSSLREAQCSGGKVSEKDIAAMHELFPHARFRFSWGSTETCAPTSVIVSFEDMRAKPDLHKTIGKLNDLVELRVVGEDGADVADGEIGEAYVRSSMVFSEYLLDPERTREAFDDDRWFKTGDLLTRDAEGFFYLVDRKKDMIKSGGENVYAFEVESIIAGYPGIIECAVVGIPDERFGEAVAAVVVTEDGRELDAEQFVAYCKRHMASYKKPRFIAYMDALPRNSVGKLQKRALVEDPPAFVSLL